MIKQGEKIKHPIYVTVEYSRKFWNNKFKLAQHGEINKKHGEIKKAW